MIIAAVAAMLAGTIAASSAGEFPLKNGDLWVMAGDSITAQHLHSNYFEAFCYARYPKLKFAFRNSGVGGHTIPTTLARFDYDIAAWKPTVVSVELGMNDSGGTATDKFVSNMGTMVERIRSIGARPVILAASPVNDGTRIAKLNGRNIRLHEYADALREFSTKENIPYADQFHALVDLWGANKPKEILAGNIAQVRTMAFNPALEGVEHLKAFLALHDAKSETLVSLQGDPVHPGPPGQLMMAAALLKALGAEPEVSKVNVAVNGGDVAATGCKVTNVKSDAHSVSFDRLDECLPFPIPDNARVALPLSSDVLDLSVYELKVSDLAAGDYFLKINGATCATLSAEQLAKGVNLTSLAPIAPNDANPIRLQSQAILRAVEAKESLVNNWRGLSQRAHAPDAPDILKKTLADLTKLVEEADAGIRKAATPQTLHFEIVPKS